MRLGSAVRSAVLASIALVLAGCGDTLIYGERTGFNMAVSVDATRSLPIEVNIGMRRSVVAAVPPLEGTNQADGKPQGDAVNMLSFFDLGYKEEATGLGGDLTIGTQFISGKSAALFINPNDNKTGALSVDGAAAKASTINAALGVTPGRPLSEALQARLEKIATYVRTLSKEEATNLARTLGVDPLNDPSLQIRLWLARTDEATGTIKAKLAEQKIPLLSKETQR